MSKYTPRKVTTSRKGNWTIWEIGGQEVPRVSDDDVIEFMNADQTEAIAEKFVNRFVVDGDSDQLERDDNGNVNCLLANQDGDVRFHRVALNKELVEDYRIMERAKRGDLTVMESPMVSSLRDSKGLTPLHHLALNGFVEVIRHPAVAFVRTENGSTPLHYLARRARIEVLQHPSVAYVKDNAGRTPLHSLAAEGRKEVLSHPEAASVNLKDQIGRTPLHDLAIFGKAFSVDELLQNPRFASVKDDNGRTPLHWLALTKSSVEMLKHPQIGIVRDDDGRTPLHELARNCLTDDIHLLLQHPRIADALDKKGKTPLHEITKEGRYGGTTTEAMMMLAKIESHNEEIER